MRRTKLIELAKEAGMKVTVTGTRTRIESSKVAIMVCETCIYRADVALYLTVNFTVREAAILLGLGK
jgi:hypothetical protein